MESCDRRNLLSLGLGLLVIALLTPTVHGTLFKFAPREDPENICILLDTNFALAMKAMKGTDVVGEVVLTDQSITSVTGNCGINNAVMRLNLFGATWAHIFTKDSQQNVELDRILHFIPVDVFLNDTDVQDSDTHILNDPGVTDLFDADFSYLCDTPTFDEYKNGTETPDDIEYVAEVTIFNIHVQAFNVQNGTFSPAEKCSADNTTTTSTMSPLNTTSSTENTTASNSTETTTESGNVTSTTEGNATSSQPTTTTTAISGSTTTTIATTVPPAPKKKKYEVKDGASICIVLEGAIRLNIKYEKTDESSATALVNVPEDATAAGSCSTNSSQNIVISFFNGWSVKMVFSKDTPALKMLTATAADQEAYSISNVTLTYKVDDRLPNDKRPRGSTVVVIPDSDEPDFPKKSASTSYYKCNSKTKLQLDPNVQIDTTDLRFKAFNADDNSEFTGSSDECSADEDSDDIIPIVVGCSVGGLLLIIILGVAIVKCRKGKRRDYKEV